MSSYPEKAAAFPGSSCACACFPVYAKVSIPIFGWSVFTGSGFQKYFYAHAVISSRELCLEFLFCFFFQRSRPFIIGFWPCPLCAVISPASRNLLIILWTRNDETPCCVSVWQTPTPSFLNLSVHNPDHSQPTWLIMRDHHIN